jgi:NCS1 family nucleobase:cation symporter-1
MDEGTSALRDIEEHHIDIIPDNERHGRVWHQFTLWLGANTNIFNVVLGGVVVSFGLTFWWAFIAIVVGTAIGALLIALHATQGPKLGVPQMIQSRGQFGFYGSTFLFLATFLLTFGFIAAQFVIQAQALNFVVGGVSIPVWIVILTVPAVVIGIYGYKWVHRAAQLTAVVVGVTIIVVFAQALAYKSLPASENSWHAPTFGLFVAGAALLVIDMLSFGPFVSDYSRYLPKNVKPGRVFSSIYFGNIISTVAACTVGAYLAALLPSDSSIAAIGKISGSWALVIFALSLVNADTYCAYTGGFQILSLANMFRQLGQSRWVRIIPLAFTMAVGMVIALIGYQHFVSNLSNFLNVLLVIFIPWSAINLTDYFIVRHAQYDVPSFFNPNGVYGKFAWRGLLAYAIGLGLEFPFVSQTYYTGPFVKNLGGADISWLVGFVVSAGLYLALTRLAPMTQPQPVLAPARLSAETAPAAPEAGSGA